MFQLRRSLAPRVGPFQLLAAAALFGFTAVSGASAGIVRYPGSVLQPTPPFVRRIHAPPFPPAPRRQVTAADVARARADGWQQVAGTPPFVNGPSITMLMTDGTILVQDTCLSRWASLAPDQSGSYVNGTWTVKASMPAGYGPEYYGSAVLPDGKLIVNGGEYNNGCSFVETNQGAIYDPVANTWTPVAPPSGWSQIGDAQSVVLANGTYMLGNCCYYFQALLNEAAMSWTQTGPGNGKQDYDSEEGWTLLRDGSVLSVNVTDTPFSEAYDPNANMWAPAGELPVNVIMNTPLGPQIGPQTMLPNDTVFVAGGNGHTAIYDATKGTWAQGPDFPIVGGQQLDVADGPSTVLTNGTVMIPASPGFETGPASYFIFDGKKFIGISAPPNGQNECSCFVRLLMLPNGQVLEVDGTRDVEIFTPPGKPDRTIAPAIASVPTTLTHGNTYRITGRRFNGFSQANMYGADVQQATNYPLVRIVNNATKHVFYARTHDHSFMGIASNRLVSTMFDVPAGIETGASTLVVVANGIASPSAAVTIN